MADEKTIQKKNGNGKKRLLKRPASAGHSFLADFAEGMNVVLERTIGSFETAVVKTGERATRRTFVFFLALLGVGFLFFGLAKTLATLLIYPGAGESVVGVILLTVAGVLFLFLRGRR